MTGTSSAASALFGALPKGQPAAAIDLGTNTVLMVVGRNHPDGRVEILDDVHAIARMGQGVDAARRIHPDAVERVCGFLDGYRRRAAVLGVDVVRAFGTSALRDAANRDEIIAAVAARAGVKLTTLTGEQEARLTHLGASFGLELPPRYAVVDIGGGSTELALGSHVELERSISVDVGAVRLTERHFPALPPTAEQRATAAAAARQVLGGVFDLPAGIPLVGVAGTATTLGALDRGLERFDAADLNGHFLAARRVSELADYLLSLTHDEICAIPQVSDQRADIIGAGSLILDAFLQMHECPGITISTRGIRYGLLLEMLDSGRR